MCKAGHGRYIGHLAGGPSGPCKPLQAAVQLRVRVRCPAASVGTARVGGVRYGRWGVSITNTGPHGTCSTEFQMGMAVEGPRAAAAPAIPAAEATQQGPCECTSAPPQRGGARRPTARHCGMPNGPLGRMCKAGHGRYIGYLAGGPSGRFKPLQAAVQLWCVGGALPPSIGTARGAGVKHGRRGVSRASTAVWHVQCGVSNGHGS